MEVRELRRLSGTDPQSPLRSFRHLMSLIQERITESFEDANFRSLTQTNNTTPLRHQATPAQEYTDEEWEERLYYEEDGSTNQATPGQAQGKKGGKKGRGKGKRKGKGKNDQYGSTSAKTRLLRRQLLLALLLNNWHNARNKRADTY